MYLNFGVVCHFKFAVYDCGCDNKIKKLQQNCKHLVQHIYFQLNTLYTIYSYCYKSEAFSPICSDKSLALLKISEQVVTTDLYIHACVHVQWQGFHLVWCYPVHMYAYNVFTTEIFMQGHHLQ